MDKIFVPARIANLHVRQPSHFRTSLEYYQLYEQSILLCKTRGIKNKLGIEDRKIPKKSENDEKR